MAHDHYIPRVFLKPFLGKVGGKSGIWVFTKGRRAPDHIPLDRAASAPDYYRTSIDAANPDAMDNAFRWAEDRVGPILDGLRKFDRIPAPRSKEWAILRRFLVDLMGRNPRMRDQFDPWADEIAKQAIAEYVARGGDVSRWMDRTYFGEHDDSPWFVDLMRRAFGHSTEISDQTRADIHAMAKPGEKPNVEFHLDLRHWRLLKPVSGSPPLITSDDPVVIHDGNGNPLAGLKNPNTRVTVVLAPNVALQGCLLPVQRHVVEINPLKTMWINWIVAKSAHREIFAKADTFQWKPHAGLTYTDQDWFQDRS